MGRGLLGVHFQFKHLISHLTPHTSHLTPHTSHLTPHTSHQVSMAHKWAVDAVDRLLQDIHQNSVPFGGVPILFVGDFRQLLPVHRFAADPSAYCVKMCMWFSSATIFSLTQNIRAVDPSWGQFVLSIGNGTNSVTFPHKCCCANVLELIDAVWQKDFSEGNCRGRAILTTTRADAGAKAFCHS